MSSINRMFKAICTSVLCQRDGELLHCAIEKGRQEGSEEVSKALESMFSAHSDTWPESAELIRGISRTMQSLLLAVSFEDTDAAALAATELEEITCDFFTKTDCYSLKIMATRVLVFCYLYLHRLLGEDLSTGDAGRAIENIHAMFEALCGFPDVVSALHYELAKKSFSSLPGGRKSRQMLLKDIADIRQDVQTLAGYLLDVKNESGEIILMHDMKPYKAVVHTQCIHGLLVYRHFLFTASADGTVKVFDCLTLSEKGCFVGHKKDVLCMAASAGKLFTGSSDRAIRVWDLSQFKESKHSFRKHQNDVTALVVMDNNLYSASADSTILVWRIGSVAPLSDIPVGAMRGHRDSILALKAMPKQKRLVSGCRDSVIKVWDAATMSELFSFVNPGVPASIMALSESEEVLFTNSWDCTLRVWNLRDVSLEPRVLRGHSAPITSLAVSCESASFGVHKRFENLARTLGTPAK